MALWGLLLPVAVERAWQTYTHTAECEYTRLGGSGWTVCSYGKGKDLPPAFKESLKQINTPGSLVHPLFYRAAFSPLFAPGEKISAQSLDAPSGCGECGKEGKGGKALMRCARCYRVEYCSKECQKLHWKVHKRICTANKPCLLAMMEH